MINNRNKWEQGAGLGKRVSTQKGGVMHKKKRADKGEAQGGVGNAEEKKLKRAEHKNLQNPVNGIIYQQIKILQTMEHVA